jgi:hypothetical protein
MATRLGGTGPAAWPVRKVYAPPPARTLVGGRGLRRALTALTGLIAALALAQGLAATAAARIVSSAVQGRLGGSVHAQVSAWPFWRLGSGRFQHLTVVGRNLRSGGLAISRMRAVWSDGRVDMRALEAGRPLGTWIRGGELRVRIWLGAASLLAAAPHGGALEVTSLRLRPPDVLVRGHLRFDGLDLPFRASGRPRVVDGGDVLVFLVTLVNAGPIVLRYALGLPVFDLRRTALSHVLWISDAHVTADGVVVDLANRPASARGGRARLS